MDKTEHRPKLTTTRKETPTDEQKSFEKEQRRIRYKQYRANMSEEQRALERERDRIRTRKRRANMDDRQKAAERERQMLLARERRQRWKENVSDGKLLLQRERQRVRARERRARKRELCEAEMRKSGLVGSNGMDDVNEDGSRSQEQMVEQQQLLLNLSGDTDSTESVRGSEKEASHEHQGSQILNIQGDKSVLPIDQADMASSVKIHKIVLGHGVPDTNTREGSSATGGAGGRSPTTPLSRYEAQRGRDWNTFAKHLKNHKSSVSVSRYKRRRENMSEEQRALVREHDRIRTRKRRANMDDHKKALVREQQKIRARERRGRGRQLSEGEMSKSGLDSNNMDDLTEDGSQLREQLVEKGQVQPDISGDRGSFQSTQESKREHSHEHERRPSPENAHLIKGEEHVLSMHKSETDSSIEMHNILLGHDVLDMNTGESSSARGGGRERSPTSSLSRCEAQQRRDWNMFSKYLENHKPPIPLCQCSDVHVIEFLKHLDQVAQSKVHISDCSYFEHLHSRDPCSCPLKQAWGSQNAMVNWLRAAFEENAGQPESNPFMENAVRIYLREVRDSQAKARALPYGRKTVTTPTTEGANAAKSAVVIESGGRLSSQVTIDIQPNMSDLEQMDLPTSTSSLQHGHGMTSPESDSFIEGEGTLSVCRSPPREHHEHHGKPIVVKGEVDQGALSVQ